jgi:hypothetical protein
MHKKAQPKNDKRNIESRSVKTSAFKDKYSWVGHFVKQKRPEKDLLHTPKLIVNKWEKGIETKKKLPAFLDFYSLIFTPFFLVFSNSYFFTLNRILISM